MKNLLVVEEDREGRETLAKVLKQRGFRVVEAADEASALELIRSELPLDIVIAGATERDRSAFLVDAHDQRPGLPVVFLTDYSWPEARLRSLLFAHNTIFNQHKSAIVRVLFVNGREDARQNPGGDTVQLERTRQELERLGGAIEERQLYELDNLTGFHLAHLFNIQMTETAWQAFQTIQKRGLSVVFSPIYWDIFPYWFELAVQERARWQWLARLLGQRSCSKKLSPMAEAEVEKK